MSTNYIRILICSPRLRFRKKVKKMFNLSKGLIIYDPDVKAENMFFTDKSKSGPLNRTHGIAPQKTCAVVGCSGILLNSYCGEEIDGHDFIIRTNLPGLRGFEADVGVKQNITTINAQGAVTLAEHITEKNLTSPTKVAVIQRLKDLNGSILFETKRGSIMPVFKEIINGSQSMSIHYQVAYSLVAASTYSNR